mgnify:CR=1 FL=1
MEEHSNKREAISIYYCRDCESIFARDNSHLDVIYPRNKSDIKVCPFCGHNSTMLYDNMLNEIKIHLYDIFKRIDILRTYIDKFLSKLDKIALKLNYYRSLGILIDKWVISWIINKYVYLGDIIDEIEETLKLIKMSITNATDYILREFKETARFARLSKITDVIENLKIKISEYAKKLRDVIKDYPEFRINYKKMRKKVNDVMSIDQSIIFSAEKSFIRIIDVNTSSYLIITSNDLFLIDVKKKRKKRLASLKEVRNIKTKKGLLSRKLIIETIDGQEICIKVPIDAVHKIIQELDIGKRFTEYSSQVNSFEIERKAIKPTTRRLRSQLIETKKIVLLKIEKLRNIIFEKKSDKFDNQSFNLQRNSTENSKNFKEEAIREILRDLEEKFNSGQISTQDYFRLKKNFLMQLQNSKADSITVA